VPAYALGIDIGGTFTDIVVYDQETGRHFNRKVLTTHADPSQGTLAGIRLLIEEDRLRPEHFVRVVHATTLFTNALIERKGAVTGLITTEGFRDTLEIGRERKFDLYDLNIAKPEPLVPRNLRLEVPERLRPDGSVRIPLDEAAVAAAADRLVAAGCTSLALLFLHSYINPAHEDRALEIIAARHPAIALTASHDVAPEIREFERSSTTVCNAYIKPMAGVYLERLATEIARMGIKAPLFLMLSSGGLTNVEEAKRTPVRLLESGPAAGALAGAFFGGMEGENRVLAFDMGGTTAKLAVVDDGEPLVAYAFEAARQRRFIEGSGLPVKISTIELIEIGAGGGSIAAPDEIGLLKVGPRSAGSEPGPAAYGRGGMHFTVTDSDFMLGYLNPGFFAGGTVPVHMDKVEAAATATAKAAALSPVQLGWGVHDIVNENMAGAARVHIAERGRDPRTYTLLPTGGAGPVHAYYVAKKLGIRRIVAPQAAGVASALGLLMAPAKVDRVGSVNARLDELPWAEFEASYARLEDECRAVIAETGLDPKRAEVRRLADLRCVGQAFEVVAVLPPGPYADAKAAAGIREAFAAAYRTKYTRPPPNVPLEVVNIRVSVSCPVTEKRMALAAGAPPVGGKAQKGTRRMYWLELKDYAETPVWDRYSMRAGDKVNGPAVIEERESTLVVGPGAIAEVSAAGNLVVTLP